jgi:hypothetical protein
MIGNRRPYEETLSLRDKVQGPLPLFFFSNSLFRNPIWQKPDSLSHLFWKIPRPPVVGLTGKFRSFGIGRATLVKRTPSGKNRIIKRRRNECSLQTLISTFSHMTRLFEVY